MSCLKPGGHHEGLLESRAAHLPQVAELDEADALGHLEPFQDRELRILGVQPVELVQRRLDRQVADLVDAGRAATRRILLEHEHATTAARREAAGDQPADAGADDDRVEARAAHPSPP
jgi:hypothetical protein